jgi:hypothetical protein
MGAATDFEAQALQNYLGFSPWLHVHRNISPELSSTHWATIAT